MLTTRFPSLAGRGAISIDLETCDPGLKDKGPGPRRGGFIAGISVGTENDGWRAYFPVAHGENGDDPDNLDGKKVLAWLDTQLQLPVPKIGANILYDLDFLTTAGLKPVGPFYDIQVAETLIDETRARRGGYSLDSIAEHRIGAGKADEQMVEWIGENFDTRKPKEFIWKAPAFIVAPYAIGDVDLPLRVFRKQKPMLERLGMWELFLMEAKLIPMLLAMRQRGVRVDVDKAEQLSRKLKRQQNAMLAEVKRLTGFTIEPWKVATLVPVLEHIGIKPPLTPKTRKPSVTADWLEELKHPVTDLIKKIRHVDKLRETFIEGYIIDGHTNGRIHCQFHQLRSDANGTVSGRFSSSAPNLQNIPQHSEDGAQIRECFVPEAGEKWWKYDLSQIEYRLMVNDAVDLQLPGAAAVADKYRNDPATDFHKVISDLTGLDRTSAKRINFGIAYGMGTKALSDSLGLPLEQTKSFLRDYHARAPFMRPLADHCKNEAEQFGEIRTLLNRRRCFNTFERIADDWAGTRTLLDYDTKGMPAAIAARIEELGGFWGALLSVMPELKDTARVTRGSTSSGLTNGETGERLSGTDNVHVYIAIADGADVERFLKTLHVRCWLVGLGWMMIGAGARLLERAIIDRMVGGPERLCFEGGPELVAPVQQDKKVRRPVFVDGGLLDTLAACPPLTVVERSDYAKLKAKEEQRLAAEIAAARSDYIEERTNYFIKWGMSHDGARRAAERQADGVLPPEAVLPFDDEEFAECTVGDIIADPERFIGATLADPLEGVR